MHLKRWITSIVALPLLFLLIIKGGPLLFAVFVGILVLIALWEYFRILGHGSASRPRAIIQALGFVMGAAMVCSAYMNSFQLITGVISLNLLTAGAISVFYFKTDPGVMKQVTEEVLGVAYIPLCLSHLVFIRNGSDGVVWICFLLCIVFVGDIGAYYVGSYLGRHKLCPAVSPKKTVEGAIGGLAAGVVAGALFNYGFLPDLTLGGSILFCTSAGLAGQVGDLFESEFKRLSGIKDSGSILPGHGGVLDRFDALMFAAPAAYILKPIVV
jgi:phosphatidate cytidylyltransferase